MGTQCLNINHTSRIVGTVSVKEVTLLKSGYIYAGLLNCCCVLAVLLSAELSFLILNSTVVTVKCVTMRHSPGTLLL